jgi:hypothetical protein
LGRSEIRARKLLEKSPAFSQGSLQIYLSFLSKEIEDDVRRWIGFNQFLNTARGRMQTQLQFIE